MTIPPIFIIWAAQHNQPTSRTSKNRQVNRRICTAPRHLAARAIKYATVAHTPPRDPTNATIHQFFNIFHFFALFTARCCRVASTVSKRAKAHNNNARASVNTRLVCRWMHCIFQQHIVARKIVILADSLRTVCHHAHQPPSRLWRRAHIKRRWNACRKSGGKCILPGRLGVLQMCKCYAYASVYVASWHLLVIKCCSSSCFVVFALVLLSAFLRISFFARR